MGWHIDRDALYHYPLRRDARAAGHNDDDDQDGYFDGKMVQQATGLELSSHLALGTFHADGAVQVRSRYSDSKRSDVGKVDR